MPANKNLRLPQKVRERILQRAARGEKAVVVIMRDKIPSKVFGFQEYLDRKKRTQQIKPWEHRKKNPKGAVDPLGAVEGTVLMPITRENIYDDDASESA